MGIIRPETPKPFSIANAKSENRIAPQRLHTSGPKSTQSLFCMSLFQMQMKQKWSQKAEAEFMKYAQFMLEYFSIHNSELKNQHAESIAAAICLLVGSKVGISKKDFL